MQVFLLTQDQPPTPKHTHTRTCTGSNLGTTFDVPQGILDELQMYGNMPFQDFLPHTLHIVREDRKQAPLSPLARN